MTYSWVSVVEDALARVDEGLRSSLEGLNVEDLDHRPGPDSNPIGWLAWHVTRGLDAHLADLAGTVPVWDAWRDRFDLPYDADATGYGMSSGDVGAFTANAGLLTGYWSATWGRVREILHDLADDDPERVVDERWDPPVTLAARLVSLVNEAGQHLGQIGYAQGLGRA